MNDDSLIESSLAGDTVAFGQLVRKYQDRLYNTMVRVIGSTDEARDVVQDAFVQAYLKLESYKGSAAFYSWLYRIAFNAAVSRRRRHKPTVSVDRIRDLTGDEPLDMGAGPADRLEQQERVDQVQAALATLSEEHRQILVLREMDGSDYATIADILDLPVGTVRSRLHRARLQLREQLKGLMQAERT